MLSPIIISVSYLHFSHPLRFSKASFWIFLSFPLLNDLSLLSSSFFFFVVLCDIEMKFLRQNAAYVHLLFSPLQITSRPFWFNVVRNNYVASIAPQLLPYINMSLALSLSSHRCTSQRYPTLLLSV